MRTCSNCGSEFEPKTARQFRCKSNCGREFVTLPVSFVGVDGEAVGGKYVLLGVGDQQIENPDGLKWKECFEFLYRCYQSSPKGTAFIGFFLGYDFTQILSTLPEGRARLLLTRKGIAARKHRVKGKEPHPVECDGWQFDLLGSKRLRIRPKQCGCRYATCHCKHASWMYVCDVGPYWQTSFLNVIDPSQWAEGFISREEYETVRKGKESRSDLVLDASTRYYNMVENLLLARCMSELNLGFEDIGIHLSPKQWFGPGQAASKWLKDWAPKKEEWLEAVDKDFLEAARESYFGGWFEITCHGLIEGSTHEYDINSAYPSIIAKLPCLLHGRYTRGNGLPSVAHGDVCFVRARVYADRSIGSAAHKRFYLGPMPHRATDGSISRPGVTEGWYNWQELAASCRAGLSTRLRADDIYEWVKYEPCDCSPPFRRIANLYLKRLAVGKNTVLGKSSKLVYNSAYGKFAQSIGDPIFGNAIYACLITSGCRVMILDAIASHPNKSAAVAMVATDALFFLEPHPNLPISDRLGEWDYTERRNLTIFKPGVYWDDITRQQIREASKPKFKARGIDAKQFAEEIWRVDAQFGTEWNTPGNEQRWPDVVYYSSFGIVSALQALMWNKWELAGTVREAESRQCSDPSSKRNSLYRDVQRGVWRTEIKWPSWDTRRSDWDCKSVAYEKRFGVDDPFSEESRNELGITEDGSVADAFRVLLKNEE